MRIIFAALALLPLAACQSTLPPPPQTTPYTLNEREIEAVKQGVRDSLKDPTSALFREDFRAAQQSPGVVIVCGLVNGKNSFGGYTGDKPFMGVLGTMSGGDIATFNVTSMGGTDTDTSVTITMCQRYGVV